MREIKTKSKTTQYKEIKHMNDNQMMYLEQISYYEKKLSPQQSIKYVAILLH